MMSRFLRGFHQWGPEDLCYVARLCIPVYRFIYESKKFFLAKCFLTVNFFGDFLTDAASVGFCLQRFGLLH